MRLLSGLLNRFVRKGVLRVYDVDGKQHSFGDPDLGPDVAVRLHDKALYFKLFYNPKIHAPEAYMDGTLTLEDGADLQDFFRLVAINRDALDRHPLQFLLETTWFLIRKWHQHNPLGVAAKHVQHHYDLSRELYELFLDEGMNYSCAYFVDPEKDTLEEAQTQKLKHAISKLNLKPGMSVAEIGSGWGGFAIEIARETGAKVTAINVSKEQLAVSRVRAKDAGVEDLVEFRELDYRELQGTFDRVVSVGMMEHVGIKHFNEYFSKIKELLKEDGFAFIHCIGRMDGPGTTGPFIRKYIFPGGYSPALSEVFPVLERNMLWVSDLEVLRSHYAYTLRHWFDRFQANRDKAANLYDERFCRMWEFYLAASEVEFTHSTMMVFQLLLSRRRDAVPSIRDYMFEAERDMNRRKS